MAEHEAIKGKQGDSDQKHRTRQPESGTSVKKSLVWDEGKLALTGTPFVPRIAEHAAIISRTTSPEQNHAYIMRLQQTYGNRYVQRLLKSIQAQAKLTVSSPDDAYEQEADRVAEKVVRSVNRQVQRQPEDEEEVQTKPVLERQPEEEEEDVQSKSLQRRDNTNNIPQVDSKVEDKINAARSGGRPIDKGMLLPMQQKFGADFSKVRIHTDDNADILSQSLQAKAFTSGKDIFFKDGEYKPESSGGQLLLAHELAHTIQQGSSSLNSPIRRQEDIVGMSRPAFEQAEIEFKKMKRSRIRGGMSKDTRRIEAVKYINQQAVVASKTYGTDYGQQIINGIRGAYKIVFKGEELPKPDISPGPDTYFTMVQNARFIKASSGGTGGVFFLYLKRPEEGEKVNPDVVVKFEPGEAVRGKFAETFLRAGGLEVTRSQVYTMSSSQGQAVKSKIETLVNSPSYSPEDEGRLRQVFNKIGEATAVIISDYIASLGTVGDLTSSNTGKLSDPVTNTPEQEGALIEAFNNAENGVNLGKLLVFDSMLGNEDRLGQMNLANVMLAKRGEKWTFALIDNDAEVPSMLGALETKLKSEAQVYGGGERENVQEGKLTIEEWVEKLIEGGPTETKDIAKINFIDNPEHEAVEVVKRLLTRLGKSSIINGVTSFQPSPGLEAVVAGINLNQLQITITQGIKEGARTILNFDSKTLNEMLEKESNSLGKSEKLSAYGIVLKQHYVRLVFDQKKKHEEAKAEIEAMASKKMKDLTGQAKFVRDINDEFKWNMEGKIKTT